jgi:tripartite-type tricarboxylate transporter receptor subunit TctC
MQRRTLNLLVPAAALAAALGAAAPAIAQTPGYPSKPIRMIIPSTPGGGTDFIGRLLSTKLAEMNGWSVVPDNKPGAGTALGLAEAARASPAGYDLVVGQTDNVSLIPLLLKVAYDPVKDLTPVALVATTPMMLVVPENSPYKTLNDLVQAAKAAPGTLSYGTSGTGGGAHISMELLQGAANFKAQHVPYKGSTPALADVMGGHLAMAATSISSATTLLKSGKMRALAVTSPKRVAAVPEVPTVSEAGLQHADFVTFYGIFAPAGLPQPLLQRLNADFNKILALPDVRSALQGNGLEPQPISAEEFAAMVKADIQKNRAVIQSAHIKVE